MSLKLGNVTINKIRLGSTLINKVYLGSSLIYPNAAAGGPAGPNDWGTRANDATVGTVAWGTPGSVSASFATTPSSSGTSQYLKATNYGFSIPGGATITGVTAVIRRSIADFGESITDNAVRLVIAGTPSGNNKSTGATWSGGPPSNVTFGGSSDLWGLSLTPSDINNVGFGVAISAIMATGSDPSSAGFITTMTLTIDYTA